MKIKHSTLAACVSAALTMGIAGHAAANVYALSSLGIEDLTILITQDTNPTDGLTPATGVTIDSFDFTLTNTATLNGVSSPTQSATCGGTPGSNDCGTSPTLNAAPANAPGGTVTRTDNTFGSGGTLYVLGAGSDQYATSDSVILTAQLVDGVPSSTSQIAESELQTGKTASSNAEIQSQTGFIFSFNLDTNGGLADLYLNFTADTDMRALINELTLGNSAQANMNVSFTLDNNDDGSSISWAPQGTIANDCTSDSTATCIELADAEDLNRNVGRTTNGTTDYSYAPNAFGFGDYGIYISGLYDGSWTLSLNSVTSTRLRRVPEPGSLALLGIGLVGFGLASRRRKLA